MKLEGKTIVPVSEWTELKRKVIEVSNYYQKYLFETSKRVYSILSELKLHNLPLKIKLSQILVDIDCSTEDMDTIINILLKKKNNRYILRKPKKKDLLPTSNKTIVFSIVNRGTIWLQNRTRELRWTLDSKYLDFPLFKIILKYIKVPVSAMSNKAIEELKVEIKHLPKKTFYRIF